MTQKLAWGILGTGAIAKTFAKGVQASRMGRLVAIGSRSKSTADNFADQFAIDPAHRHASYDALFADPAVEAVYVATPHPHHAHWAIRAAAAKKHLLVEKPIGL